MMQETIEQSRPYVFGNFHSVHPPLVEELKQLEKIAQKEMTVINPPIRPGHYAPAFYTNGGLSC